MSAAGADKVARLPKRNSGKWRPKAVSKGPMGARLRWEWNFGKSHEFAPARNERHPRDLPENSEKHPTHLTKCEWESQRKTCKLPSRRIHGNARTKGKCFFVMQEEFPLPTTSNFLLLSWEQARETWICRSNIRLAQCKFEAPVHASKAKDLLILVQGTPGAL
eukprot:845863-Pelagomonas_calceolata.AAC.1